MTYDFHPEALQDLDQIWEFIRGIISTPPTASLRKSLTLLTLSCPFLIVVTNAQTSHRAHCVLLWFADI
jgi:hypothetical protein